MKTSNIVIKIIRGLARLVPKRIGDLFYASFLLNPLIKSVLLWWENRQPFYQRLIKNLIIGVVFAIPLHSCDEPFIRQAEDDAIDWIMAMQRGDSPVHPPMRSTIPFAFLDIDEAVYRNWGEPLLIPRNKLLDIIRFAVSGDPALIVIDVDLSRCGQCLYHDCILDKFLNEYHGSDKPPIILPQLFKEPEPIEKESGRILREPFFGKKNFGSADARVFFASPLFELDKSDFHLRHWRLWEIANNREVIPSVELLAVALFKQPYLDPASVFQNVKQKIRILAQVEAAESQHSDNSMAVKIAGMEFKNDAEDISQRILYTIPWTLRRGDTYPDNFIKRSVLPITRQDDFIGNSQEPSDQCYIRCAPSGKMLDIGHIDSSWLKGRVVVIGASFKESRDTYATPIGQMPGAMVIANAINSLYEHGQIEKPGIGWIISIEIVLIVIMSIAFAWLNSFMGMLVSSIAIISIMLPLSFYLFKYGVWLDFVIPLIAVVVHSMHALPEENKAQRGRYR